MSTLLEIAARVEAAAEAYKSIQGFADSEEWGEKFKRENRATAREFHRIWDKTKGGHSPLHPILAALSIVVDQNQDLGMIDRSHPGLQEHAFYHPDAEFPADLSDLLPPSKDRWWETLAEAARKEHTAQSSPPQAPPTVQRKVRLIVPPPRVEPEPEHEDEYEPEEEGEDLPMVVDEEHPVSQSRGSPVAAKEAAATRKRKGSSAAMPRGTSKRRHRSTSKQRPDAAERGSDESSPDPAGQDSKKRKIECDRCRDAGDDCTVVPNGPCKQCKSRKLGCSLMPKNPRTGRADRRAKSASSLLEFRLGQIEDPDSGVKKGKERARDPPGAGEQEGTRQSPSPLTQLAALETLKLNSGGSSAANTPAGSPAVLSQLPFAEHAPPVPPSTRKICNASKPRARAVAEPGDSNLLMPVGRQAARSPGDASPASDDGDNAARIAALESKQAELERRFQEFDRRLAKLGG